jgi:hypothetical protein
MVHGRYTLTAMLLLTWEIYSKKRANALYSPDDQKVAGEDGP